MDGKETWEKVGNGIKRVHAGLSIAHILQVLPHSVDGVRELLLIAHLAHKLINHVAKLENWRKVGKRLIELKILALLRM